MTTTKPAPAAETPTAANKQSPIVDRLLTGHARGDTVWVDWHDGNGRSDAAVVLGDTDGGLTLRFVGDHSDRFFAIHDDARGLYESDGGTVVEISRTCE